jgi:hypothetical protein
MTNSPGKKMIIETSSRIAPYIPSRVSLFYPKQKNYLKSSFEIKSESGEIPVSSGFGASSNIDKKG